MKLFPKKRFFNQKEEKALIEAIRQAEKNTSGEVRVHLESKTGDLTAFERALVVFQELEMHQTELRNGVLFYLAAQSHQFSIVADEGINEVVPDDFWENIKENLQAEFAQKRFAEGIIEAIQTTGEQLKNHFPFSGDDQNELPNEISQGD
jgi:uncharacterized membrane protein